MTIRNVLQIGSLFVSSSDWYSQEELQIFFFYLVLGLKTSEAANCYIKPPTLLHGS